MTVKYDGLAIKEENILLYQHMVKYVSYIHLQFVHLTTL